MAVVFTEHRYRLSFAGGIFRGIKNNPFLPPVIPRLLPSFVGRQLTDNIWKSDMKIRFRPIPSACVSIYIVHYPRQRMLYSRIERRTNMNCPCFKETSIGLCDASRKLHVPSITEMDKYCFKTSFRRCPLFHKESRTGTADKGVFMRRN